MRLLKIFHCNATRAARGAAAKFGCAGRHAGGRQEVALTLEARTLLSTYYVSAADGSDANGGSFGDPFATIQKGADAARAGDTVIVRGGTYRELVRPARSGSASAPITFRPYRDETVTVSGADPVSGWSKHGGSVYKAPQGWDLGTGNNQVFVDGRMMTEARWPNTGLDVSRPSGAVADGVTANVAGVESFATLRDAGLSSFRAGAWNGATIHFAAGQQWVWQTGRVSTSAPGSVTFSYEQRTYLRSETNETPRAGNPFFLTGKFVALDAPGEWFRDASTRQLYLWSPRGDDPSRHAVEAKRRQYAFDLRGRSYVDVLGFNVFAATIASDDATAHVRLDGITARYVSHFSLAATGWEQRDDAGIILRGSDNVLRNSTVAYSAGHGVYVSGVRNVLENNVIRDVDYAGTNGAGVRAVGRDHLIVRNSISAAGRSGIQFSAMTGGRILHNDVSGVMLQTTDGGAVYTYGTDGGGMEIAYNRVHGVHSAGKGGTGIMLDDGSSNYVVHHNVTFDVDYALKANATSRNNRVYNNTLSAASSSVASSRERDMTGSVFVNNIFTRRADIGSGATVRSNVGPGADVRFVDAGSGDLRLRADSPAVDAGQTVAPYTFGQAGAAPDVGACEYGRAAWTAGRGDAYVAPAAPPAPSFVSAVGSSAGVRLSWSGGHDADGSAYLVYAATSPAGPYTRLNQAPLEHPSYLHAAAPPGRTTYYRVVVLDSRGDASAPASTSGTRPADASRPVAPQGLAAATLAGPRVELAWRAVPAAAAYRLERKAPGAVNYSTLASGLVDNRYVDGAARPGVHYTYRVRAENSLGASPYSAAVGLSVPSAPPPPAALAARRTSSTAVTVSWRDVAAGETGYIVERSRNGSGWIKIRTFSGDVTDFSDSNLPAGARYLYRVRAFGLGGTSSASKIASPAR